MAQSAFYNYCEEHGISFDDTGDGKRLDHKGGGV